MSRLPVAAFAALIAATVAAFFVTQHLKVTTPLIAGAPAPFPAAINPLDGRVCNGIDHRFTKISFYLLHRSDDVDVYVVDQSGAIIRTLASGRHMRRGIRIPDGEFQWDGREDSGRFAPDGSYYIRVALIHQGRTVVISNSAGPEPVTIKTSPPHPAVSAVAPALIPQGTRPVTIHYTGNAGRGVTVRIYRTDVPGRPRLVKSFYSPPSERATATWDGRIHQRPAPAGIYLMGLDVTDAACNTGHFPVVIPPPPGASPHAGVTVRYLAAEPPLDPSPAGGYATVYVDARHHRYRWTLRREGVRRTIASGLSRSFALRLRLPSGTAGLYALDLSYGARTTAVPLEANALPGRSSRVLVVLPALSWQGTNAVDDDGDGMPNTLAAGLPIELQRPFAAGLPQGFGDQAALVAYLDRTHLSYDLTTDLGLIDGVGPPLAGHRAVVLAGSERWLTGALGDALRSYVMRGGRVLSLGIDALRRTVTVQRRQAVDPTAPTAADVLGARPGAVVRQRPSDFISVISDQLGIFSGTAGVFQGFGSYQPFAPPTPPARLLSAAGATATSPSIIGYATGRGVVVDIGLPGFGSILPHNVDAQELIGRLWKVLGH